MILQKDRLKHPVSQVWQHMLQLNSRKNREHSTGKQVVGGKRRGGSDGSRFILGMADPDSIYWAVGITTVEVQ